LRRHATQVIIIGVGITDQISPGDLVRLDGQGHFQTMTILTELDPIFFDDGDQRVDQDDHATGIDQSPGHPQPGHHRAVLVVKKRSFYLGGD